ncbi:MAG: hypothetical protein AB1847_17540 [bacterium]
MKLITVYGPSTLISISLAGLPTGSARSSLAIDNTVNRFLDAMVTLSIPLGVGSPVDQKLINIWFYASEDGTGFLDNASGLDQSIVKRNPTNWRGPFVLNTPDSGGLVYTAVVPSVGTYFNKVMPRKWGVIIENQSGVSFDATEANFSKSYSGVSLQFETPGETLHDSATVPGPGTDIDVTALSTLNLQITGTATSFSLAFLGAVDGEPSIPISGINLKTFSLATVVNNLGEIWQVDVSSLKTFRAELTAVSGGSVTVKTLAIP